MSGRELMHLLHRLDFRQSRQLSLFDQRLEHSNLQFELAGKDGLTNGRIEGQVCSVFLQLHQVRREIGGQLFHISHITLANTGLQNPVCSKSVDIISIGDTAGFECMEKFMSFLGVHVCDNRIADVIHFVGRVPKRIE